MTPAPLTNELRAYLKSRNQADRQAAIARAFRDGGLEAESATIRLIARWEHRRWCGCVGRNPMPVPNGRNMALHHMLMDGAL